MDNKLTVQDLKTLDEMGLRNGDITWPKTEEEFLEIIRALANRKHDYGTCAAAMSIAAYAAFCYMSEATGGATGFQASCADLDFIRRSRHIKGPFMLIKGEDGLYPQYDLVGKLQEALREWRPWFKEQAQKRLTEKSDYVHSNVVAHWEKLAAMEVSHESRDR